MPPQGKKMLTKEDAPYRVQLAQERGGRSTYRVWYTPVSDLHSPVTGEKSLAAADAALDNLRAAWLVSVKW